MSFNRALALVLLCLVMAGAAFVRPDQLHVLDKLTGLELPSSGH